MDYSLSVLSGPTRRSRGSRFSLKQQTVKFNSGRLSNKYTHALDTKHMFSWHHMKTYSVSFFTRKSSQTIKSSVSLKKKENCLSPSCTGFKSMGQRTHIKLIAVYSGQGTLGPDCPGMPLAPSAPARPCSKTNKKNS